MSLTVRLVITPLGVSPDRRETVVEASSIDDGGKVRTEEVRVPIVDDAVLLSYEAFKEYVTEYVRGTFLDIAQQERINSWVGKSWNVKL